MSMSFGTDVSTIPENHPNLLGRQLFVSYLSQYIKKIISTKIYVAKNKFPLKKNNFYDGSIFRFHKLTTHVFGAKKKSFLKKLNLFH